MPVRFIAARRSLASSSGILAAGALLLSLPCATAFGGFEIITDHVEVDAINNEISFTIEFTEEPNFFTLDPNGNPLHAFQYEIDGDWEWGQTSFGFDRIDSVIRGLEIYKEGDLRVRDSRGSNDPDAGGWGRVLDSVPFELDGNAVSFTVQKDLIDDSNGKFQYRVFALEGGEMTSLIQRQIVPLPTAVWSGLSLFGGLCAVQTVKRLRKTRVEQ